MNQVSALLDRIRIVLCGTTHPGNIGAAARAMKTMGLRRLVLVDPQAFPAAEATARASGADELLTTAQVVSTVDQALAGVHYTLGTSARLRHIPLPVLAPRDAAATVAERPDDTQVAILFGRERTGLTNDEINHCQALLHIPTDDSFSSLNLGAAVQLVCYELRLAWLAGQDRPQVPADDARLPADGVRMAGFFAHLEQALLDIRFLTPGQSDAMLQRLRRLFHRAEPDDTEINILRGILSRAQQAARGSHDREG